MLVQRGQYVATPHGLTPMVGASGAISALFGAYALLFGERRGRLATHRFGKALHVVWLAAAWIGFQLLVGLSTEQEGAAIAVAAHIGGVYRRLGASKAAFEMALPKGLSRVLIRLQ